MSRYLITTGDESTWKIDRPVIFLGKWCLSQDRKEVWNSLDFSIVDPSPIRQSLPELFEETQQLYSQLSADLRSALNTHHGLALSSRFWNVIIGPWLGSFCDNVVLRWAYLSQAISEFGANESYEKLDDADFLNHPRNFLEYRNSQVNQAWNQYMYTRMWNLMSSPQLPSPAPTQFTGVKASLAVLAAKVNSASSSRVILTNTYLPRTSEARLAILMGSRPTRIHRVAPPVTGFDPEVRSQLEFPHAPASRIHAIGRELVRDQILSAYVEGFKELLELVHQLRLPDAPSLIFTSNRHLYDDVFNAWVAQATELGSKYVIGQHGGNYGLSKFPSFSEIHEGNVSDGHLTWGRKDSTKQLPGPCLTTVGRKCRTQSSNAKHLMIVCDNIWTYPRSLFFDISESAGYLEYVAKCVTGLPPTISGDVVIRLNSAHAQTGSSQIEWWKNRAPQMTIDPGLSSLRSLIRKSRLVVTTYNGTTFLETLNLNIPTVITWDDNYVQLRPEALPYFQHLQEVGIFHRSDQSFVDHVTKHWDDIWSWWNSEAVQSARQTFCTQYSRREVHPLLSLRGNLRTVSMAKRSSA